ncbi:MAG: hypothetical protein LBQ30_06635 [Treponema sp.]|nr:hypothetical protein [Treponema sp.]
MKYHQQSITNEENNHGSRVPDRLVILFSLKSNSLLRFFTLILRGKILTGYGAALYKDKGSVFTMKVAVITAVFFPY